MPRMRDFERWFNEKNAHAGAAISNFRASEFIIRSTVHGVTNTVPPEVLWINVWPLAKIVQMTRTVIGEPIAITSGYRSPEYNKAIRGATNSQHVAFKAADLVCTHVPVDDLYRAILKLRRDKVFSGGVAKYSTFVHVDVRGTNANWYPKT